MSGDTDVSLSFGAKLQQTLAKLTDALTDSGKAFTGLINFLENPVLSPTIRKPVASKTGASLIYTFLDLGYPPSGKVWDVRQVSVWSPGTDSFTQPGTALTQTDVDASSALAASANNVILPAAAGATTYITGFEITGDGATAGSIIAVTVTGILGGTKTYFLTIPAGVSTAITPLIVEFARPLPASGVNTAIVVNVPSFGAGNTNAAVTAHGFQQTPATPIIAQLIVARQVPSDGGNPPPIEHLVDAAIAANLPYTKTWSRDEVTLVGLEHLVVMVKSIGTQVVQASAQCVEWDESQRRSWIAP